MSNPYQAPNSPGEFKPPMSAGVGNPMQPLFDVAGWLTFIGWFNIVIGVIYALTIVGILMAWLPIWIGICLKNAAESLKLGYPANDAGALHRASSNLATTARIVGVLCIINIVIMVLYIGFIVLMLVLGIAGASMQ